MLTRTHTQTHKLSWLPDEISSVPSLSSQLQGPITTLQACQPLLTAMRRWKWKGRMGGGFWKYLEEGVHFIAAIETLWMLSLSDLSDRFHQQLADAVAQYFTFAEFIFMFVWVFFFFYKERVKYSHHALSCSLRYPSLHSFTSVPVCFMLHISLQRLSCPKWKRFKKSDSDHISLWRSVVRALLQDTHTHSTGRWAQSVTQGNSLHFINFRTFFRCEGKPPTHACSHTTFHFLLCFPHALPLYPLRNPLLGQLVESKSQWGIEGSVYLIPQKGEFNRSVHISEKQQSVIRNSLMGHFSHIPVFTCLNPVLNYSAKLRH